ncbi:hypothetical protein PV08_01168 [Exophiala spinifera]|uniref:Multiple myeloma tumor-associated protein 2-like N-terminal domain-containing protein n=1 Tax=Exophiala spinifera TaxID=91928 RepID=A0A0D2BNW2_9EURO|nr:uncharacterized protein PV08_01168 [Exophiala spinifera]KIW20593.1 hypothetical protein PV08_01168 [Exophiala spinifera]
MDLLATVRKEGSRGGTGDFKWSDVQTSSRRENYLGHSLMAPVGRWQKGRDLNWYAKGETPGDAGEDADAKAARERREEIRRIKEAEEDALARALGLPVAPRNNPNMEELGTQREVRKVLKEAAGDDELTGTRGVGYGRASDPQRGDATTERLEGTGGEQDRELKYALKEYKRRHGDRKRRRTKTLGTGVTDKSTTGTDGPGQSHLKDNGSENVVGGQGAGLPAIRARILIIDGMKKNGDTADAEVQTKYWVSNQSSMST